MIMTQRCEHPGHQSGIDTMLDQCRWENLNPLTLGQHRGLFRTCIISKCGAVSGAVVYAWKVKDRSNPTLVWAYNYVHKGGLENYI